MTETCPICASADIAPIGAYRGNAPALEGLTKMSCGRCGMVFVSPMPSAEVWDAYNANYFETAHGSGIDSPRARAFRNGLAKIRVAQVLANLAPMRPQRVLEVGAGYGEFLAVYRDAVPEVDYAVVDTDAEARRALAAKGATVHAGLDDVPADRDLLVLSHVLEHTREPGRFLAACLDRLEPGAGIFIDVPCRDDLYKDGDEPHLLFFDKPALQNLMASCGLRRISLQYCGDPHSRLQAQQRRGLTGQRIVNASRRLAARFRPEVIPGLSHEERDAIAPFAPAHQSADRARWLRAFAIK